MRLRIVSIAWVTALFFRSDSIVGFIDKFQVSLAPLVRSYSGRRSCTMLSKSDREPRLHAL